MSATRDRSQKFAFVYSNLYRMYQKEKEKHPVGSLNPLQGVTSGKVLKAEDLHNSQDNSQVHSQVYTQVNNQASNQVDSIKIEKYRPVELIQPRIAAKTVQSQLQANAHLMSSSNALNSLKNNLQTLNQLHDRLKFMLKELEELTRE